jgi:hypothetical protein
MEAVSSDNRPAITATNHSAFIFIATALCLVCMTLFLSARLVVRWPWSRSLGPDDWTTLSASVGRQVQQKCDQTDKLDMRIVPEYSLTIKCKSRTWRGRIGAFVLQIENGAQSMDPTLNMRLIWTDHLQLLYVSDVLYVPTMFVAQLAVSLFFLRLSGPERSFFHRLARFIGGASVLFALVCFLMIAIRVEDGLRVWEIVVVAHKTMVSFRDFVRLKYGRLTSKQLYRWIATGVLSVLIESLLIICPAWLLWTLHMPLRKKLSCAVYFSLRFP